MVRDTHALSPDAFRLLHAIGLYGNGAPHAWLKDFSISVMVHLGVKEGVFEDYDLAPSLVEFRGIKVFARISQEAIGDMDLLFRLGLVERMILNTRYYAPTSATRISPQGQELLKERDPVVARDRATLDRIVRCRTCGTLLDFAVGRECGPTARLVISRVCACISEGGHRRKDFWHCGPAWRARRIDEFFCIGNVVYSGKACFLGVHGHGE